MVKGTKRYEKALRNIVSAGHVLFNFLLIYFFYFLLNKVMRPNKIERPKTTNKAYPPNE